MERFQNTRQPDWGWWSRLWPTPGETLRCLGVSSGTTLVEVGAGDGYLALPAARVVEPATVYALDLDESLLDELQRVADQQEIGNVEPIHGDARELSRHLPEPVGVVLLANALHGVEETDAHGTIPLAATYVVDESGTTRYAQVADNPADRTYANFVRAIIRDDYEIPYRDE